MDTLPDYLDAELDIVSIGLNPSINAVRAGFYFATGRNRFWPALNVSRLVDAEIPPGVKGCETLFETYRIGMTDVVKRPSRGASALRAADFREWAPMLGEKLRQHRPAIAWFHGKLAWDGFLKYGEGRRPETGWGEQSVTIDGIRCFVTPNPSPANAAFSLDTLAAWFDRLAELRDRVVACKG